jgi:hypothetical protein
MTDATEFVHGEKPMASSCWSQGDMADYDDMWIRIGCSDRDRFRLLMIILASPYKRASFSEIAHRN